jgi:hypothetical protein
MDMAKDFLAEIIDERMRRNARFPNLIAEAEERRKLARKLVSLREAKSLSQTVVAACNIRTGEGPLRGVS